MCRRTPFLCLACAVLPAPGAAADTGAPWLPDAPIVRAPEFSGPQPADRPVLLAELRWLVGEPASEPNLRRAVEVLGSLAGAGGIGVRVVQQEGDDGALVTFRFDARSSTVEHLEVTDEGEGPPAPGRPRRELWRRIQASRFSLALAEGRPFHPYLLELDRENVHRYFLARGYVDAEARAELSFDGDLATVVVRVLPGPRFRIGEVRFEGLEEAADEALRSLRSRLKPRARPVPWELEEEAARLRGHLCGLGYADAKVGLARTRRPEDRIDVTFRVVPGLRQRISQIVVGHPTQVLETDSERGLTVGGPFCPDQVERAAEAIREELQQYGFLEAFVGAETEATGPAPGETDGTVAVRIHVRPGRPAIVDRIWFEGTDVTRERVLRDLVSFEEGDLLLQEEIDASLQNLRHSGLFRRASARVFRSGDGLRHYVSFRVVERDVLTIDPTNREVTLHNLHLYGVPSSLSEPGDVVGLRGSGQELWLHADGSWLAGRLRDAFLMRHLVLSLQGERRVHTWSRLEEVAYGVRLGLGYTALANRLQLVPLLVAEYSSPDAPASYGVLPVLHEDAVSLGLGLDFRFDYNDRDAERVPYLGLGIHAQVLAMTSDPATREEDWYSWLCSLEGNVPLYRNRGGQHVVLHAEAGTVGLLARGDGLLAAHHRLTPTLRGYSANAMRIPYLVGQEEVLLGGTAAWTATLQVRVPLPWRRNALSPFVDGAGVGALGDPPWQAGRAAAGLRYDFSLLDERLEGYAHLAWPLGDDTYASYYDTGFGGSF